MSHERPTTAFGEHSRQVSLRYQEGYPPQETITDPGATYVRLSPHLLVEVRRSVLDTQTGTVKGPSMHTGAEVQLLKLREYGDENAGASYNYVEATRPEETKEAIERATSDLKSFLAASGIQLAEVPTVVSAKPRNIQWGHQSSPSTILTPAEGAVLTFSRGGQRGNIPPSWQAVLDADQDVSPSQTHVYVAPSPLTASYQWGERSSTENNPEAVGAGELQVATQVTGEPIKVTHRPEPVDHGRIPEVLELFEA